MYDICIEHEICVNVVVGLYILKQLGSCSALHRGPRGRCSLVINASVSEELENKDLISAYNAPVRQMRYIGII